MAPPTFWSYDHQRCPECYHAILFLTHAVAGTGVITDRFLAFPFHASRPVPPEVPDPYREDFTEACKVLDLSPKASAALTRRCLQAILREKARTTRKDLNDQIEEIIGSKALPSYIADDLHAVRVIGNFAAHPLKSTNTGEVLELLFDFYFVGPAVSQKRKRELNQKLKEAGKPALK